MLICLIVFLIYICCGAIFIPIAYALEAKESKKRRKEKEEVERKEKEEAERKEKEEITKIVKSHIYTREEYIKLYNYCMLIKNKLYEEIEDIKYFNSVLNKCEVISEQPYYTPNYSDLCFVLLKLLWEYNYSIEQINYGILT